MFFYTKRICALLFFVFLKNLFAQPTNSYDEVLKLYCPEKQQTYQNVLNSALRSIRKTERIEEALEITLKTSCKENLPEWRIKILFLLSHFVLENGVSHIAVERTLPLFMHDSMGKEEYLRITRLAERLSKTGLFEEEIKDFFLKTKKEKMRAIQLEGIALYYVQLRAEGLSQTLAYEEIMPLFVEVKKIHHQPSIYKWVRGLILQRNSSLNIGDALDESLWDYYYQKVRS